jgi:hypothetical protein
MSTTLHYSATADEGAHRYQVTLDADYELEDDGIWNDSIAEQCAHDWHNNYDGWEAYWPRVFVLYKGKTGPAFAKFEVDRETIPQFNATPA